MSGHMSEYVAHRVLAGVRAPYMLLKRQASSPVMQAQAVYFTVTFLARDLRGQVDMSCHLLTFGELISHAVF